MDGSSRSAPEGTRRNHNLVRRIDEDLASLILIVRAYFGGRAELHTPAASGYRDTGREMRQRWTLTDRD